MLTVFCFLFVCLILLYMLIQLGKNWHFENSDEPIAELGFCKATMNIENESVSQEVDWESFLLYQRYIVNMQIATFYLFKNVKNKYGFSTEFISSVGY